MTYPHFKDSIFYSIVFTLAGLLYLLPHYLSSSVGTAYIIIVMLMTLCSVFAWYRQIIPVRSALIFSLVLCIFLAPLLPYTSNDSERYLWDGAVFLSGFDPYITAPDSPLIFQLREVWPTPEEHAEYSTLYPPGALILFSICALAGPVYGIWVWKIMVTLAAMVSVVLTYKLLSLRKSLKNFHLFAFSPLLLFETQIGAHLDIFSVLGIVAALWCLQKDYIIRAGIIIGLAAAIKFLPAVIVGPFLFYLRPHKAVKLFLASAGIWLCIYAVMIGLGYKPLGLLPTFFEKWRGGAPLFPILESTKDMLDVSDRTFLLFISVLALTGFSLSAWLARHRKIDFALMLSLTVPLILSPVLFPWYLLVLVPFLALKPNLTVFTAITLAPLSYVILDKWLSEGIWEQAIWPSVVLLIGIIIAFIVDVTVKPKFIKDGEKI